MQDFLTLAIEAIATASFVYLVSGFALVSSRTVPAPVPTALPTQAEADEVIAKLEAAAAVFVAIEPIATAEEPVISEVAQAIAEPTAILWRQRQRIRHREPDTRLHSGSR